MLRGSNFCFFLDDSKWSFAADGGSAPLARLTRLAAAIVAMTVLAALVATGMSGAGSDLAFLLLVDGIWIFLSRMGRGDGQNARLHRRLTSLRYQ